MASHRIHLRGPWDYVWLDPANNVRETSLATSGTVAMPREWQAVFGDVSGTARFLRKFHRPTNLDPHESVFIVLTKVRGSGTARLNDTDLGSFSSDGGTVAFDISQALEPFNQFAVDITFQQTSAPRQSGGLYGVVALEIRSS
jgi:hypothetical protein